MPIATIDVFYTKQRRTAFQIQIEDHFDFTNANLYEARMKIEQQKWDRAVFQNGIDVRQSLTNEQKERVIQRIQQVMYGEDGRLLPDPSVFLSRHLVVDYLLNDPRSMTKRGWSPVEGVFYKQVCMALAGAAVIEKVKINFPHQKKGRSHHRLTYTVRGFDGEMMRRLSILFGKIRADGLARDTLIAVTVLPSVSSDLFYR